MQQLHVGMKMTDAEVVMRPVCIDWGIAKGRNRLYFQISSTQEMWLDFAEWPEQTENLSRTPNWRIERISTPERKQHWRRDENGALIVR
jgi:hypothetical protein